MESSTKSRAEDRVLHIIIFLSFIPAFILQLAGSIACHHAVPALGIIAMVFSLITLMILRALPNKRGLSIGLNIAAIGLFIGILIPQMIVAPHLRWWSSNILLVNAFGVAFTFPAMGIHIYFLLRELPIWVNPLRWMATLFGPTTCPHCQRDLHVRHSKAGKKAYVSVPAVAEYTDDVEAGGDVEAGSKTGRDEEGTPRASVDDETARLL